MADLIAVYDRDGLAGFCEPALGERLGGSLPTADGGPWAELLRLPGGALVLLEGDQDRHTGLRRARGRAVTAREGVEWLLLQGRRLPEGLIEQAGLVDLTHAPPGPNPLGDEAAPSGGAADPAAVVPAASLPPARLSLPELTANLLAVHYSQELQANSPAQTPPVSAVVVQNVLTGEQVAFAAFRVAERLGLGQGEWSSRFAELERQVLSDFYDFVARHPDAVWLHWAMRQPRFGFEVLAQRALLRGLSPVDIPPHRKFDLSSHLKRAYGEEFAPHPRLPNAMRRNGLGGPELLDEDAAKAAWARGEHARLLVSLSCKVDAIADLYERVRAGTFEAGAVEERRPASREALPRDRGQVEALIGLARAHVGNWHELYRRARLLQLMQAEILARIADDTSPWQALRDAAAGGELAQLRGHADAYNELVQSDGARAVTCPSAELLRYLDIEALRNDDALADELQALQAEMPRHDLRHDHWQRVLEGMADAPEAPDSDFDAPVKERANHWRRQCEAAVAYYRRWRDAEIGHTRAFIDLLQEHLDGLTEDAPDAATSAPVPGVVLRGRDTGPIVRGKEKPPLTERAYNIVEALVRANRAGLTKDQLDQRSGHSEARKVLRQLRASDPDWEEVICMPGKAGQGGYRLR